MNEPSVPRPLRDAIARDLGPTRPLRPAWIRALLCAPLAGVILVGMPYTYGVRSDIHRLGPMAAWGLSVVELAVGFAFVAYALNQSLPGRTATTRRLVASIAAGALFIVLTTLNTEMISPTTAPAQYRMTFALICFRRATGAGFPAVATAALLAARALPLRPVFVGALCGMGAGFFADAGQRLFCNVSAPSHVLLAHGGAVLALMAAGAAISTIIERGRASSFTLDRG